MIPPATRSLLAAVLAGALAVACAGDDAADPTETAEGAAVATDDAAGEPDDEPDEPDVEPDEPDVEPDTDDADPDTSDGAAEAASGGEATWLGETFVLDRTMCVEQSGVGYVVRATNDDVDVAVVYDAGPDPTNPTYDFAGPDRIELYRGVPGGSVGDGEVYEARPELDAAVVEGVTGSEAGASGTVVLVPNESTAAAEANPDGGELTFAITC